MEKRVPHVRCCHLGEELPPQSNVIISPVSDTDIQGENEVYIKGSPFSRCLLLSVLTPEYGLKTGAFKDLQTLEVGLWIGRQVDEWVGGLIKYLLLFLKEALPTS